MAAETLRDWLLHYRRGGFDALYPKPRADRGQPRRLPAEVAELLISMKTEHQSWSVRQVIAGAVASGHLPDGVRPAHSTVHRLLRAEGLMSKPTAAERRHRPAPLLLPLRRPVVDERCHARSLRSAVFVSSGGQFRVSPNTRRRQPIQRSRGGRRAHADRVPGAELQASGRPLRA